MVTGVKWRFLHTKDFVCRNCGFTQSAVMQLGVDFALLYKEVELFKRKSPV